MTINSKGPLSGLTPQQISDLEEELQSADTESAQTPSQQQPFATDQLEPTMGRMPTVPGKPGLVSFEAGLHPGSGFPQGTLETGNGYLVVPNTTGFGFQIYPPGSKTADETPIAITTDKGVLIGRDGSVLADFTTNNQATLPFGLTVTTHSSSADDPFNGSISFSSGGSQMRWNVVEGVQDRLARDKKINQDSTADLAKQKGAADSAQADLEKAGTRTGWGIFSFLLAPFTGGLSLIPSAIVTGTSIAKGVEASKTAEAAQKAADEDQALANASGSRINKTSQNVYELEGTRRILKDQ